jgi:hypothetical protein
MLFDPEAILFEQLLGANAIGAGVLGQNHPVQCRASIFGHFLGPSPHGAALRRLKSANKVKAFRHES